MLHAALRIGFLGDFVDDLYSSQTNWFARYHWNFYVPAMAIYYVLYKTFHLFPLPYHAFHLALIFINAWLVYLLAQELEFEPWQCWVAGLLALFNSGAFETYFWLSTIPKVLGTSFGLVALIFLNRFRQSRGSIWGWGYLVMLTIGIAMESTTLILPLIGLSLDSYYRPWSGSGEHKGTMFSGLRLHYWTFSVLGIVLLIRYLLGIRPYVVNLTMSEKFITLVRTILDTFFHGLPEHFWFKVRGIPLTPGILLLLLLVVLILALRNKHGSYRRRFFALLLLWMVACLPNSIAGGFHSRYLYFPGIFSALVLADLMGSFRLRVHARNCTWLLICLIISGYLSLDFFAFHQSLKSYLDATRTYNAGIQKIRTYLPEMPSGTHLILVDFPDFIDRPLKTYQGHQNKYSIWVYRNALPAQLLLLYKNSNFTVTFLKLSPPNDDNPAPLGTPSSPEQLRTLLAAPQSVVCRYLPGNPGEFVIAREAKTILIN